MTKILRDYIKNQIKNEEEANKIIRELDNHYDEAIDFAADALIVSKQIDEMIEDAKKNEFKERDLTFFLDGATRAFIVKHDILVDAEKEETHIHSGDIIYGRFTLEGIEITGIIDWYTDENYFDEYLDICANYGDVINANDLEFPECDTRYITE